MKQKLTKEQRERLANARRKRLVEAEKKSFVSEQEKLLRKTRKKKLANEATIKVFEETSGIEFVEFMNIDDIRDRLPPPVTFHVAPWEELDSIREQDDKIISTWIIDMLKSESVADTMIFMYQDLNKQGFPDFAKVTLSDNYEWVAPLWKRGHGLYLYSFERGYCWQVFSFDDRRAFLRIKLK